MLPDFSTFFRREKIGRLHFRVRNGPNYLHDMVFLSSYLHDSRFLPEAVTRRGKKLMIAVNRDCWELGYAKHREGLELHTANSRLTLSPVSSVRWEIHDLSCLASELWIESIYVGAAYWETPDVSEIVISAPHGGWKLSIGIADDTCEIRLDDLETPHLHPRPGPEGCVGL